MADPIKTEAEKARQEFDAAIATSKAAELEAAGWIKSHWALVAAVVGFGVGVILGHLI